MTMKNSIGSAKRVLFGFIAGFLATLIFHQLTLWILWSMEVAPFAPFSMAATKPFGVPAVFSLAFWGGIWGIVYVGVDRTFPRSGGYWVAALLFGAILPSAVALLVVLPLKGLSMSGGWHLLLTALLVNGAWGIGTGLMLKGLSGMFGTSDDLVMK